MVYLFKVSVRRWSPVSR